MGVKRIPSYTDIAMKQAANWKVTGLVSCILMLGGCMVMPEPLTETEVRSRVDQDLGALTQDQEPVVGAIDLYEAMARALKYNLDVRVEVMEKMLAHQKLDLSHYELLPQIVANANYEERSNFSGGVSRSLLDGTESLEASTSSEKDVFSSDLTLSWDILDFGLSYIRAKQAADDVLIAEEEKRRAAIRVLQEVHASYWRAVSADRMLPRLTVLSDWIERSLATSRRIKHQKLASPLIPLRYQRELIESQRQIQRLHRDLVTAKIHLAALMNLPPGKPYELVTPPRALSMPTLDIDVKEMEYRALVNRPELRAVDYQKRINAKETKAALLELLPHISVQGSMNYNSNDLLFESNWLTYGAKVSWNLLKAFTQPARLQAIDAQGKVLDMRSLALSMTILSQVHVSMAKFSYAKRGLLTAERYYKTQAQIAEHTRLSWISNRLGTQVLVREKVSQVVAELRYLAAKANMEAAYAKLLATMGEDPLPAAVKGHTVAELADALRRHWASSDSGGMRLAKEGE